MISAITDGCSVRYAQLDSKIYKFQSLVFKEENQTTGKAREDSSTKDKSDRPENFKGILTSRQTNGEWRQVYGEYLHRMKERNDSDSGSPPKSSSMSPVTKRAKVEERVELLDKEKQVDVLRDCQTCSTFMEEHCDDFNALMSLRKEDLAAMLIHLKQPLMLRSSLQRKNGYCPTEDELKQLQESNDCACAPIPNVGHFSRQAARSIVCKKGRRFSSSL